MHENLFFSKIFLPLTKWMEHIDNLLVIEDRYRYWTSSKVSNLWTDFIDGNRVEKTLEERGVIKNKSFLLSFNQIEWL